MAELGTNVIILIMLLFLSGFFSGAEVALISLTSAKVQTMLAKKQYGARHIKLLKDNPQRMLSAILIGNNIANIAAASLMTVVMIGLFSDYAVGIATGVMTLLILVFGEITPKSIAASRNERVAQIVAPPIWYLSVFLRPVLVALDWFLNGFLKLFGLSRGGSRITEEEIIHMVSAAEREGSIQTIEKRLITNVLEMDETTVGEIITPRADITSISADATVGETLRLIAKRKHSRIPIFEGQRDNVVGIVYLRDLLGHKDPHLIKEVMQKPYFVPETKPVPDILRKFQKRKEHLAIVVDEHGTMTGLITLEDVLEEIVGEIVDESETIEPNVRKAGKRWIVRGRASIDEVNMKIGLRIPEGDYDTISGFFLTELGRIPKKGESLTYKNHTLKVKEIKGQRIAKMVIASDTTRTA